MSIGNTQSQLNCYNLFMESKGPVARWLEKKYVQWINDQGVVRSQKEFAEFLGLDRVTFNRYYNGSRERMDYKNALQISSRLGDFELLDILGYERPSADSLLEGYPPEFRKQFSAALGEARSELVSRGITEGTDEAREIINMAFRRHGLQLTFIENP